VKNDLDKHRDILGKRPDRHHVFSKGLLAEEEDRELTAIVQDAASKLGAPIALVTLVLERIQFFKAHYGLPDDLAAARATERDVSFCQFVVRDEAAFEVVNAEEDQRVPQALVERHGIKAYLGIPLRVDDVVVGSLCVLDTQARTFSDEDHERLTKLAQRVSERLESVEARRLQPRAALAQEVVRPGLAELRGALDLAARCNGTARMAAAALSAFLRVCEFESSGGSAAKGVRKRSLEQAMLALEDLHDATDEVELNLHDVDECTVALERVVLPGGFSNLQDVLNSAQDLSRHSCRAIGGAPLPILSFEAQLLAPSALAIGIITCALNQLATQTSSSSEGLRITVDEDEASRSVVVSIAAPSLPTSALEVTCRGLSQHIGDDPTIRVAVVGSSIAVTLSVL
jgi:hypothetical protein